MRGSISPGLLLGFIQGHIYARGLNVGQCVMSDSEQLGLIDDFESRQP